MFKKLAMLAAMVSMGLMASACHNGHPGHDSDHPGGYGGHYDGGH